MGRPGLVDRLGLIQCHPALAGLAHQQGTSSVLYTHTAIRADVAPPSRKQTSELPRPTFRGFLLLHRRLLRLERRLLVDPLTGVGSRWAWERARKPLDGAPGTAIAFFDAASFKRVNDLSHVAGDEALRHFAGSILRAQGRLELAQRCWRWGGDEFVAATPVATAAQLIEIVELSSRFEINGFRTALIGASGATLEEADQALAQKRNRARGRYAQLRRIGEYRSGAEVVAE